MINRALFILIITTVMLSSIRATAQFSMPDNTYVGTEKQYWVDSVVGSGSTYTWKINNEIQYSGPLDRFSIIWNKVGTFFLEVQETSASNCQGEVKSGWVNVTEIPVLLITCPSIDIACAVKTVPEFTNLNAFLLAGGIIDHNCALDSTSFMQSAEVITGSAYPESYEITREYSVSDSCGNTTTCTIVISVPGVLSVVAVPTQLECYDNSTGKIDLTTSGGTPPYTFVWNNGETSEDISGLGTGINTVLVTDKNGCTTTSTTAITVENSLPIAGFIPNFVELMTYSFYNTSSYAETYSWSFGDDQTSTFANPRNTYADIGTYLVTLTVSNNCGTDVTSKELTVALPDLEFYNGFSPNGDRRNDYWEIPVLRYYPLNNVKIINRWGSVVWKTDNYSNTDNFWSGENLNGDNLPDGTYYYIINYGKVEKRGWVFIKR
jgi:gliding motility-associated-like protein